MCFVTFRRLLFMWGYPCRQSQYIRLTWISAIIREGSRSTWCRRCLENLCGGVPLELRPAVPSLEVKELPRLSNDRWLRFGTARVEDTRRMIWICFCMSPEVFFAEVFGVSWPSFRPTGRTTGRVPPYLEAGMPRYYVEMARRGEQASAQARTAELLAQ